MDEMDDLIDSMIGHRKTSDFLNERYDGKLQVKQTATKGDGVFAKRSFTTTDAICSLSLPTVLAIDSDHAPISCYHCLAVASSPLPLPSLGHASIDLKTCNGCLFARYCNRDCQLKSWAAYHKYECKILKKLKGNIPPAIFRAVMRAVLLRDREKISDEEWVRITTFDAHEEGFGRRGRSNLTEMAEGIRILTATTINLNTIQKLIYIMKANAIEIPTPIYGGMGVMLDPLMAKINHNCQPNLCLHRPQHTMTSGWLDSSQSPQEEKTTFAHLVPLRDISEGEELLNCYIVSTASVRTRKAALVEDYFFECKCDLCASDLEAATNFVKENPQTYTEFEQLSKSVSMQLSKSEKSPDAFFKATTTLDKSNKFLEHPALYTSGDYPQLVMMTILQSLKTSRLDEALINASRLYFLVNPQRFIGRHNPTNIYTIFLILDILDVLTGTTKLTKANDKDSETWQTSLSSRGITNKGLIWWRARICQNLKSRIQSTSMKDLLALVEKREQLIKIASPQDATNDKAIQEGFEKGMRHALGLKDATLLEIAS